MAGPDTHLVETLFDDDVEAALAALPPDFRAAVVLCDIEGLSYEEIGDVLGVKMGTVRSRIHRGRSMLRKALAHRAPRAGRLRYSGPAEKLGLAPQVT
jgi:RNA polymerase sigma-70 factor (ECF subfamily)